MAKQKGPQFISGTVGDLTYYKLNGQYYVRKKSSLSRKRVKRSPRFRRTMEYAGLLGQASQLAAEIYRMLPKEQRHVERYREWTGQAMQLLKEGLDAEEVKRRLTCGEGKVRSVQGKRVNGVAGDGAVRSGGENVQVVRRAPVPKYVPVFCTKRPVVRRRKGVLRRKVRDCSGPPGSNGEDR